MQKFSFKKIDAFTGGNATGNPAGCVYLQHEQDITAAAMQQIARELKGFVSEVAFLFPVADGVHVHPVFRSGNARRLSGAGYRAGVIPGQHPQADPLTAKVLYGFLHMGAQTVRQAQQCQRLQSAGQGFAA